MAVTVLWVETTAIALACGCRQEDLDWILNFQVAQAGAWLLWLLALSAATRAITCLSVRPTYITRLQHSLHRSHNEITFTLLVSVFLKFSQCNRIVYDILIRVASHVFRVRQVALHDQLYPGQALTNVFVLNRLVYNNYCRIVSPYTLLSGVLGSNLKKEVTYGCYTELYTNNLILNAKCKCFKSQFRLN